jgi:hypothetical protein
MRDVTGMVRTIHRRNCLIAPKVHADKHRRAFGSEGAWRGGRTEVVSNDQKLGVASRRHSGRPGDAAPEHFP